MDEVMCCFTVDKNEDLTVHEVVRWLKLAADSGPENADKARVTSLPPVRPKGGEVYIFRPTSVAHESKLLYLLFVNCCLARCH